MKKRDIATTFGLFFGIIAIIIGMGLNNGKLDLGGLRLFYDLPSIFITVGGSFFTIMIAFPMSTIKKLPATLKNAFFDKHLSQIEIIGRFTELSKKARKEGLLSLEDEVDALDDIFLKKGIQLVVDGLEPETIREILELDILVMEKRHANGVNLLKAWAGYAPAYGMIGTLIGLVQMLANLSDPGSLGPGMAKAVITSFYGAVLANFVFGPIANKLEQRTEGEIEYREMMIDGILSIQAGVNPRVIEDKLVTYLSPEDRLKFTDEISKRNAVLENE